MRIPSLNTDGAKKAMKNYANSTQLECFFSTMIKIMFMILGFTDGNFPLYWKKIFQILKLYSFVKWSNLQQFYWTDAEALIWKKCKLFKPKKIYSYKPLISKIETNKNGEWNISSLIQSYFKIKLRFFYALI